MIDLKPCPFCGRDATLQKPFSSSYKYVACQKCMATGPSSVNEEYAIEWWNKRLTTFDFNFPAIKTPHDHSAYKQALKIIEERKESRLELNDDPPNELFDLEAMDLYHSLETYFRMMKPERVDELKEKTINKNRERGYYE